jgi:hypothetical protein
LISYALVSLFSLAVISLYALIISKKNSFLTLILIGVILVSSVVSVKALFYYQGLPIDQYPEGDVQILSIALSDSTALIIVQEADHDSPRFFRLTDIEQSKSLLQMIARFTEEGQVVYGEFNPGESTLFSFKNFSTVEK